MRKRPFLLLACMYGAGIAFSGSTGWKWILPLAGFLVGMMLLERHQGRGSFFVLLLAVFFCLGIFQTHRQQAFRSRYLTQISDGQEVRLLGEITRIEKTATSVRIQMTECVLEPSSAHIPCNDVLVYASSDEYSVGQILMIKGTIQLFDSARNEGNFDALSYYKSLKIDFALRLSDVEKVYQKRFCIKTFLWKLRGILRDSLLSVGDEDGVMATMLLGEKTYLNPTVKTIYQSAGISHILAISGLHVSLLGMGVYQILRKRRGYFCSCSLTAGFMFFYGCMTGFGVSTRRAVGMLFVFLLGDFLGRSYDMLSALGAIVIVMLWDNPFLFSNSSFWLSVTAVLGVGMTIEIFSSGAENTEEEKRTQQLSKAKKLCRNLFQGIAMSTGIQWMTLPILAYSFFELPTYSIFLNPIVLSLIPYLVTLGGAASVVGVFLPWFGKICFAPCRVILLCYRILAENVASLPYGSILLGRPGMIRMAIYYGILLVGILWLKKKPVWGRILFLSVLLIGVLAIRLPRSFEVDILDVGQGDGAYLCTSGGEHLFIDGGSSDVKQVGKNRILPFLKSRGISGIDYWFVSHGDDDHTGGLKELLENEYPVGHLVILKEAMQDEKILSLVKLAKEQGVFVIPVQPKDELKLTTANITIGGYGGEELQKNHIEADANNRSMILYYKEQNFSALFAGDISSEVEALMVGKSVGMTKAGGVTLYKVNHHGSKYSNSKQWLDMLAPKVSVISCGQNSRFGHPHREALERLYSSGSVVFRTDFGGQIRILIGKNKNLQVKQMISGKQ